jgi:hypothetical protein
MALSASDVANVTVTISATDIPNPIVVALVASGGMWGGTVSQIPAGSNRTFTLSARDPAGVEQYRGTAIGVTIAAGQTTTIVITAQQVTPPPPHNNAAPVIDALVASALTVAPGSAISLAVTAHDPNPGDTLSYAWSAAAGTFTASSAPSTNWTAPPTAGTVHITIDVQDQLNAHATMSLDVVVVAGYGQGAASITVSLNTWPVVSDVSADPARVDAGQTVALNVAATDSDGDALSYLWNCDCQGSFSDTTVSSPSFTLTAVPTSNACTFTVTVEDGKGGSDTGSLAIAAGPLPAVAVPPAILSAYQSTSSADAGQAITMSVQAVDPNGGALSFAWTATQGALGQPSTTGSTSQIAWTAPTPFTASATIQVTVTDAMGQVTVEALEVEPYFPGANPDAAAGAASGTVALFHFDGINGSTVLSDSSGTGKVATIAGNPVISTAQSRFGGASLYIDGTSSVQTNYVVWSGGSDFVLEGDFTLDFWIYPISYPNTWGTLVLLGDCDQNQPNGPSWNSGGSGWHFNPYFPASSIQAPAPWMWHHVAVTRSGLTYRAFVDGAQVYANTSSTFAFTDGRLWVTGCGSAGDNGDFNGYIDELRVVKGTAVWTSDFTPPTAPYASTP